MSGLGAEILAAVPIRRHLGLVGLPGTWPVAAARCGAAQLRCSRSDRRCSPAVRTADRRAGRHWSPPRRQHRDQPRQRYPGGRAARVCCGVVGEERHNRSERLQRFTVVADSASSSGSRRPPNAPACHLAQQVRVCRGWPADTRAWERNEGRHRRDERHRTEMCRAPACLIRSIKVCCRQCPGTSPSHECSAWPRRAHPPAADVIHARPRDSRGAAPTGVPHRPARTGDLSANTACSAVNCTRNRRPSTRSTALRRLDGAFHCGHDIRVVEMKPAGHAGAARDRG